MALRPALVRCVKVLESRWEFNPWISTRAEGIIEGTGSRVGYRIRGRNCGLRYERRRRRKKSLAPPIGSCSAAGGGTITARGWPTYQS
jgi:hypothetical protein